MNKDSQYLAIIDLGSNSVRLKIDQIKLDGSYQTERYEKRYVRLSSNMGPEKILQPEPIKRTLKALTEFRQICNQYKHLKILAVATAAVRQAKNQTEFLQEVKKKTGFVIHVISGEQEAYLDYIGVSRTLALKDGVILDTGGASMEIILVKDGQAEEVVSIPLGSVLISQRYDLGDRISAPDLFNAIVKVDQVLSKELWLNRIRHGEIVALGGCNRALAKVYRWQQAVNSSRVAPVHGLTMTPDEAYGIMQQLLSSSKSERAKIRGVNKERADVIIGGLLPLMSIIRQQQIQQIQFSNSGLREGLLFRYLEHETSLQNLFTL
ncbi:Ppx/GppA family phosphatase [Limosilactobacillus fastidiosus]|uniref:Ppx/GppA family phosphatase n=1 Tax=Limosilactobacillus fastidiosus TaxID=2759855 RepID=A0A7W3YCF1_9LACO|nr:Ppx/GppA family phosphatase [Limosilactobacillus fastidiosus]MBB1086145.1 Ppx/GppA family phosphatase [Limosilactobacillus fastidiosus]MCD7085060.1 Ppx/GppA family phosphatase [Limosilactobacillus fastidiosus]MCD7114572.1 Ppx/GppA family phosphatase [Limosilactobacillus fastidiosus]MCD7116540.1 Ppx/GppA family phosphatase [Limosilactobacillus fastidiosus]